MSPIILLFVASQIEGAFTGPGALDACFDVAATYEQPTACVAPASEVVPHLGLGLVSSPRPVRNPVYGEVE